jgi:hypothetical protein
VDDNAISIYKPEELERLDSLRVQEFVHTRVYDVNLLKKGEMDIDLPTLFRAIGWSFVMRFRGKSTTGGGEPTDRAHDGGIGMHSGDVAFLHRLTDRHHQQPLQSPWPRTRCLNLAKI